MWLYGSGFPKSMNIGLAIDKKNGIESKVIGTGKSGSTSKAFNLTEAQEKTGTGVLAGEYEIKKAQNKWNGWGTCLKPAYEPIIVARKPFKGSLIDNVIENGVGGLNIDECRIGNEERFNPKATIGKKGVYNWNNTTKENENYNGDIVNGRFPANVILTYDETDFDEVCGAMPYTKSTQGRLNNNRFKKWKEQDGNKRTIKENTNETFGFNDSGSACRYFYCVKASKKDRDEGLDKFEIQTTGKLQGGRKENSAGSMMDNGNGTKRVNPYAGTGTPKRNTHPTVKPTELMQYLVRLVSPKGATILDPFMGSGSTGKACMYENKERNADYKFIGIEITEEYLPIADARINYASEPSETIYQEEISEDKQTTIFDYIKEEV